MRILFIYPNAEGYGRIPLGITIIMTILSETGHQVDLFDTTFILKNQNIDTLNREKTKQVVPVDLSHLYDSLTLDEVDEIFRKKVSSLDPDLVAITILEENYKLGNHFLSLTKSMNADIPTIVGGSTPTIAPEVILENPNIDFLIQGEGEEAMREFCDLFEKGESVETVRNLWFKKNGKIHKTSLRPFVNLDTLPFQNLDFWDQRHFFKPYNGELKRAGFFEISRGCLNKCTYCINDASHRLLDECGNYFRRKTIKRALSEIKSINDKFCFEMVLFCDDNFLFMSRSQIDEFYHFWKSEIDIPFWINTTVESVNRYKLKRLKESGCCGIGIGVESGNEWLRKNILNRETSTDKIINAFELIHEFDIRTTANCMLGFPGEYIEDIFETIKFMQILKPSSIAVSYVTPYIGTMIHLISKTMGYIQTEEQPGFRGMSQGNSFRGGSAINTPYLSNQTLQKVFSNFMDYVNGTLSIPEEYLKPAPGSSKSVPRGDMSRVITELLSGKDLL